MKKIVIISSALILFLAIILFLIERHSDEESIYPSPIINTDSSTSVFADDFLEISYQKEHHGTIIYRLKKLGDQLFEIEVERFLSVKDSPRSLTWGSSVKEIGYVYLADKIMESVSEEINSYSSNSGLGGDLVSIRLVVKGADSERFLRITSGDPQSQKIYGHINNLIIITGIQPVMAKQPRANSL